MAVTYTHAQYTARNYQWTRCRDTASGSDAVKHAGPKYLPMLSGQTVNEYDSYRKRSLFFGATKRTLAGLLGAVFRKKPAVEFSDEDWLEDDLFDGSPFTVFAQHVTREVLNVGRIGVLVDASTDSLAQAYVTSYLAENITNWKTQTIGGKQMLTQVVLKEEYLHAVDEFESEHKTQYRVLDIVDGKYTQRLFRQAPGGKLDYSEVQGEVDGVTYPVVPLMNGLSLDHIPFIFINAVDLTADTCDPPMLELVDINLSHYMNSADLEHGLHFTGLPTPVFCGFPQDTVIKIGSSTGIVSTDPASKANYLEFSGSGLSSLRDSMLEKQNMMAVVGARMLEQQKRSAEAENTVRMRMSGENSALLSIVRMVNAGLTKVLQEAAAWLKASDLDIAVQLNTDLVSAKLTPQELTSLMGAWQQGAITQRTFLYNLEAGELLPPGTTAEDEADLLEVEGADVTG